MATMTNQAEAGNELPKLPITHWPKGTSERVVTGATGFMAVFMALRTADFTPEMITGDVMLWQVSLMRMTAFAALTIWATFTIGIPRRGVSAMMVMVFALFQEWIIMPIQGHEMSFSAAAAAGVVLAFLGFQFYWNRAVELLREAGYNEDGTRLPPEEQGYIRV
ncbi:MAG: hypothetical protein AAFR41_09830 [Pseudomonadota bacterium]